MSWLAWLPLALKGATFDGKSETGLNAASWSGWVEEAKISVNNLRS